MTEKEWVNSTDPQRLLHALTNWPSEGAGNHPLATDRKLRLFACACCRRVWHLLTDSAECFNCLKGVKLGPATNPRLRQFLPPFGSGSVCLNCSGTGLINRSRRAVEVAERYADGEATVEELEAANRAARLAVPNSPNFSVEDIVGPAVAPNLLRSLVVMYGRFDEWLPPTLQVTLLRDIVGNPFRPIRFGHDWKQMWEPSLGNPDAEHCRHCAAVRQPSTETPTCWANKPPARWLTPTVVSLAQAAYQERGRTCEVCADLDPAWMAGTGKTCTACQDTRVINDGTLDPTRLLVLSDALEEASCMEQAILMHLRGQEPCPECLGRGSVTDDSGGNIGVVKHCFNCHSTGWIPLRGPHVRGCWVVDLLLGKN